MTRAILFLSVFFVGVTSFAQQAEVVKLEGLEQVLNGKSDKIHVVNFWATWCGPCIVELPFFEKLTTSGREDVSVTLVSLDMALDPNPAKVHKFVARKQLVSKVLILDEEDPDSWINRIDPAWSGALPATLLINEKTGKRRFVNRSVHEGELEAMITELKSN